MKLEKILITGAKGMVGSNIVENETSNKYTLLTPSSTELNLLDRNNVDLYLKKNTLE